MKSRLEFLKKKKLKIQMRKKRDLELLKNQLKSQSLDKKKTTHVDDKLVKSDSKIKNIQLNISTGFPLLNQKKEAQKIQLNEFVQVFAMELDQANKDYEYSDQEEPESPESEIEDIESKEEEKKEQQAQENMIKINKRTSIPKVMTSEDYNQFLHENEAQCLEFLRMAEQRLEEENQKVNKVSRLIEDFINNQDKDIQESRGGCIVRKIEDLDMENKYMANDLIWLNDKNLESERIAVAFNKHNSDSREINVER